MKKQKNNIEYTVFNDLCLGCGICADSCPTKSITIKERNGEYRPTINGKTCLNNKGCKQCSHICPGLGINIDETSLSLFNSQNIIDNVLIGRYISSYSGFAKDHETRWHGASGGLLTAFISYLLDNNYVTAAVVAENNLYEPFLNKTILVHDSHDLHKARSSKYCPVKYDGIIKQVKEEKGKVIIVGLPCIIQGFRKYEKHDRLFKDKVMGYLGLYCSCGRTFNLTEYVFKKNYIDRDTLSYFQYRDNGCLGSLVAKDKNGEKTIPFQLYYHPLRSFFIPNRCQFCIDHFSELADVSFGDIHFGKYKEDKVGVNSVIIRNQKFEKLLQDAALANYIVLNSLSEEELVNCQASAPKKKGRVGGVLKFAKCIGKVTPQYDVDLHNYNYIKSIAYYIFAKSQMFVGKRRYLWWIISLLSRKGKID